MSMKQTINNIMNTFKQEDKVMIEEGGQNVELFAREPKTWDISHETFSNVGNSGDSNMDLFLEKGLQAASDIPEDYKEATRISVDKLMAEGKSSGQNIDTLIESISSDMGGETLLEGTTKNGKKYSFRLDHDVDKNTGEDIYKINDDIFDKDDYRNIIGNVQEKLDNVYLAVNEKFEKDDGGGLSAKEYLSAAEQESEVTVGKPSGSYWQPPPPK